MIGRVAGRITAAPGATAGGTQRLRRSVAVLLLAVFPAVPAALPPFMAAADVGYSPAADAAAQPGVAGIAAAPANAADLAVNEAPLELSLLTLLNADRVANGLPELAFDPSLLPVARARAEAQKPLPSLSHWDADGQLAFVKLLAAGGVDYRLAGENLARLPGPDGTTAARAEDALMHSPTHRANILEPTFNRAAIGATVDGNGRVIYAQIFRNKVV